MPYKIIRIDNLNHKATVLRHTGEMGEVELGEHSNLQAAIEAKCQEMESAAPDVAEARKRYIFEALTVALFISNCVFLYLVIRGK